MKIVKIYLFITLSLCFQVLLGGNTHIDPKLKNAIENGNLAQVEHLISQGVKINATGGSGKTPLHYAVSKKHASVVKYLLSKGANSNAQTIRTYTIQLGLTSRAKSTPLHFAVMLGCKDIVGLLVAANADVDKTDSKGWTPLHWAAKYKYFEIMVLLLSKGANVNARTKNGKTPLHKAARFGHLEGAKLLIKYGALIDSKTTEQLTPVWRDSYSEGSTPLYFALNGNEIEVARYLLSKEANPFIRNTKGKGNTKGKTPYDLIREKKINSLTNSLFVAAVRFEKFKYLKELIGKNKGIVNACDVFGNRALSCAILKKNEAMIKYLFEHNADPVLCCIGKVHKNYKNFAKSLLFATLKYSSFFKYQEILNKYSKVLSPTDTANLNPLHLAAENNESEIITFLINNQRQKHSSINKQGETPLHIAAKKGKLVSLKVLLANGALVNSATHANRTALHLAVINDRVLCTMTLLESGAKPLKVDKKQQTPLSLALQKKDKKVLGAFLLYYVQSGNVEKIKQLVNAGADLNVVDLQGQTIFHRALREIYNILEKHQLESYKLKLFKKIDSNTTDNSEMSEMLSQKMEQLCITEDLQVKIAEGLRVRNHIAYTLLDHQDMVLFSKMEQLRIAEDIRVRSHIVHLLLDHQGIDTCIRDNQGRLPLYWAQKLDDKKCMEHTDFVLQQEKRKRPFVLLDKNDHHVFLLFSHADYKKLVADPVIKVLWQKFVNKQDLSMPIQNETHQQTCIRELLNKALLLKRPDVFPLLYTPGLSLTTKKDIKKLCAELVHSKQEDFPQTIWLAGSDDIDKRRFAKLIAYESYLSYCQPPENKFVHNALQITGKNALNNLLSVLAKPLVEKNKQPCLLYLGSIALPGKNASSKETSSYKALRTFLFDHLSKKTLPSGVMLVLTSPDNSPQSVGLRLHKLLTDGEVLSIPLPNQENREELFKHQLARYSQVTDYNTVMPRLTKSTSQFSPQTIRVITQKAHRSVRQNKKYLSMEHVVNATKDIARNKFPKRIDEITEILENKSSKILFKDLVGMPTVVNNLRTTVQLIKNNKKFIRKILLHGPGGTGKTSLAEALANELGWNFLRLSCAEFAKKYKGSGGKLVRTTCKRAIDQGWCVLFIDEIDALDRKTNSVTITQMQTSFEDFEKSKKPVILIAATNYPQNLATEVQQRF